MSDDKKLTLTPKLGVGKGVETGQVRQSFSHGRSKAVVVERKKKRVLKNAPGTTAPAGESKSSGQSKPAGFQPKKRSNPGGLSDTEMEKRALVLEQAKKDAERKAEEAKKQAALDAERKKLEEAEAAKRSVEEQAERKAAEAAQKKAEEEARVKAEKESAKRTEAEAAAREKEEDEAKKKSELEARAVQLRKASEARKADMSAAATATEGDEKRRGKQKRTKDKRKTEENRRGAGRGNNDRRGGKLTIAKATSGDEGGRQRSIAAMKRAQAKAKRQQGDQQEAKKQSREITIPEVITVQELANRMAEKGVALVKVLMGMGVMATINEVLDQDTAQLVVEEFGHKPKRVLDSDVEIGISGAEDDETDLASRAPVVTVMGHVDHGKTSLLDALRKANVVSGEAGGITQHIGAYQVEVSGQKITFLDTPGHAAFTEMRARGASVTDICIVVVAADDGVMPQTKEAIAHAKAAGVPLIIAINKMDREGANPDRVRQELLQEEVVVESFSGDVQEVEISALTGLGLDNLKEQILLQAELLELKANPSRAANGVVVEAKLDKGRGSVTTTLIQKGTVKIGDIFVAGAEWGRVRALVNDKGQQVKEAGPSVPVEVLGAGGVPSAGDDFAVVSNEARAREIVDYRQEQIKKKRALAAAGPKTMEAMFTQLKESGETQSFQVVLKADVQGSVEAITAALEKAGNDDIACRVLHGAVGGITESDITLANASDAMVIGFNVRPNKQARESAESLGTAMKFYSVIYDLIDDVKAAMAGQLGPEFKENVIGSAEILDVFTAGKKGKAAGCRVLEGNIRNDLKARILRDGVIVYEGQIENLRRFKDDVKKVESGQECGLTFEDFHEMRAGDELQVYELEEVERKL
ncbi:translation initiation factor IF-2 [Temperatibacter marinus]|uniref:Translation initiation factor IF-2 n=1 Tax=Temperatibacter marinus TaxID=1456591 RepID=A0AA52EF15_9PROT|nr:translation initiation factor IF-2 [Temperatibacter marinus]WND01354.1 translation initiation factor IF-2 [Temperatibacter marinus]